MGEARGIASGTVPPDRQRWRPVLAAGAIIAMAGVLSIAAGWENSATNDEPYHTLAAYTYVHDGHGDLNPEHPPLAKLLSGAAMLPLGLNGTSAPPVRRLYRLSEEVRRFLYFNVVPSATILRVARLPQIVFLLLLLSGVYCWTLTAWGEIAAVVALLAVASQPLVLGHAFVVHTDVAAAATWIWTLFLLHRWLEGSSRGWMPFGVALGLALLAKFSAVYLIPIAAIATLAHGLHSKHYRDLARFAGATVIAGAVVLCGMWLPLRNGSIEEERQTIAAALSLWRDAGPVAERLESLAAWSRPLAHYGLGLAYVAETNRHGQGVNFFLGKLSTEGFTWYFPAALFLKTSLPFFLLALWGVWRAAAGRDRLDLALALVVAFYLAISLGTTYNIGARHLLPVLPLLAMVGAHHAATWRPWMRAALVVGLAASPLLAFPHYLAHFTAAVGGARQGHLYLNDSNLDWGQDWSRLGHRARAEGWEPLAYAYLGAGDPAVDAPGSVDALGMPAPPARGYVAVSSFVATVGVPYLRARGDPSGAGRLSALLHFLDQEADVVGEIGHSITVYRIRPPRAAAPAPSP